MATMKRPRPAAVKALSGHRLRLTFVDAGIYTVSPAGEFDKFLGLAPLRDSNGFSKAVVIEGGGWTVEWPAIDIQIGADTL